MNDDEFFLMLACKVDGDLVKVISRERSDLEFKATGEKNSVLKSVKTIAAFANRQGGNIVFGVSERPRTVCGCDGFLDEAELQDILNKHLYPVPDISVFEHCIGDKKLFRIQVDAASRAPIMAIRDLQTSGVKNATVLSQGVIYFRRAGQTRPASGEGFPHFSKSETIVFASQSLGFYRG
ncbi:MAG: ATP-binding protein [Paracoccaceae bacterium]